MHAIALERVRERRAARRVRDNEGALARWLLAPAVIYIAALVGFPFLLALYYSVSDATVGSQALEFAGLENYRRAIENPTFWQALRNSIVFTLASQVLVVVLAKAAAMALYTPFRGRALVRFLILLTWVATLWPGAFV